jgi:hypothetical protein
MIDDTEFIKIKNKSVAIRKLYPQVATITPGDDWKCVDENNESVEIDESAVTKEVDQADAEYDSQEYARNREAEYDALNQFEMQFDDKEDGTTTWEDAIKAIKMKWPKDNSGPKPE